MLSFRLFPSFYPSVSLTHNPIWSYGFGPCRSQIDLAHLLSPLMSILGPSFHLLFFIFGSSFFFHRKFIFRFAHKFAEYSFHLQYHALNNLKAAHSESVLYDLFLWPHTYTRPPTWCIPSCFTANQQTEWSCRWWFIACYRFVWPLCIPTLRVWFFFRLMLLLMQRHRKRISYAKRIHNLLLILWRSLSNPTSSSTD